MQLRHISPGSSDWVDAMDEGGRGWEKPTPEELTKLRASEEVSQLTAVRARGANEGEGGESYG